MKMLNLALLGCLALLSACSTTPDDVAPSASRQGLEQQDSPTGNGISTGTSNTVFRGH